MKNYTPGDAYANLKDEMASEFTVGLNPRLKEGTVKLYLDDVRPPPPGWTLVRWPDEAITLLATGQVDELSLDHDLGDDARGTGYDVLLWIEDRVALHGFRPPRVMRVHSSNSSARIKMNLAIETIYRIVQQQR